MAVVRWLLAGCLLLAPMARAQDLSTLLDFASDQLGFDLSKLDLTPFWTTLEKSLQAESVDDLVVLLPQARSALGALDQWPQARPYADWLRQRLDYLEVADAAEAEVTGTRPAPRRPPPPPDIQRKVGQTARKEETWQRKMASRPAPAGAAALVPKLKDIFRGHGLPVELVWLAEVESSMNPRARSPVGAVGLFQMMPATAQRFGLRTSPDDERVVVEKNADAAARYLKFLHGRFQSWPLALAAYNAGEGRVSRVMGETGGKTFDEIAERLPSETQMYVPKMRALLTAREGKRLDDLPGPAKS